VAQTIRAIHDIDFPKLLQNLGVYEDVVAGKAHCAFCNEVVTLDTIRSVFPESGAIRFVCNKPRCYLHAMKRRGSR